MSFIVSLGMKKICVLASGGVAPGMNPCIESVVRYALQSGMVAVGALGGYDGLVKGEFMPLTPQNALDISHKGGSILRCGRSEEFRTEAGFKKALATIKKNNFCAVVVIGGNGSMRGVSDLDKAGVPVVGIPATIDNDVAFTKHSIGFSSAVEEATRLIDHLRLAMHAFGRDHMVEMMGRNCADIAETVGVAVFAEIIDTVENRHTPQQIADIFAAHRKAGRISSVAIMQEKKSADVLTQASSDLKFFQDVAKITGLDMVRQTTLGHMQTGTPPSARDRYLAHSYGRYAIDLLNRGESGIVVGIVSDKMQCCQVGSRAIPVKD